MSSPAAMDIVEEKRFLVRSSSLKDIRSFAREVFDKLSLNNEIKEEIVLAIAEAAQNIVKHAYKDFPDTDDKMLLQIKCNNGKLEMVHGAKAFLCKPTFRVTPKVGDFYFFPHYLMHAVYPFTGTDEERRSVSFNATVDQSLFND